MLIVELDEMHCLGFACENYKACNSLIFYILSNTVATL